MTLYSSNTIYTLLHSAVCGVNSTAIFTIIALVFIIIGIQGN